MTAGHLGFHDQTVGSDPMQLSKCAIFNGSDRGKISRSGMKLLEYQL